MYRVSVASHYIAILSYNTLNSLDLNSKNINGSETMHSIYYKIISEDWHYNIEDVKRTTTRDCANIPY